ncbi:MAG: YIP1 family protein [Vicinamibacterales bacterium]
MSTYATRVIGALALDSRIFEEVEADTSATPQAAMVVVASSLAAGIGGSRLGQDAFTWPGIVVGVLAALTAWCAWAMLTFVIGTRVMPEAQTRADWGQLLRTLGFASAPGLLGIFLFLPRVQVVLFAAMHAWMLAAMVVAVRQALDFTSTARAIGVCLLGWALTLSAAVAIGLLMAPAVE